MQTDQLTPEEIAHLRAAAQAWGEFAQTYFALRNPKRPLTAIQRARLKDQIREAKIRSDRLASR